MNEFLIIEDDLDAHRALQTVLAVQGLGRSDLALDATAARMAIAKHAYEMIFLDLNLPQPVGEQLLREILAQRPRQIVIVITGQNEVAVAVRCMQHGARDFLTKPCAGPRIVDSVMRARQPLLPRWANDGQLPSVDEATDAVISAAMLRTHGNLTQAAQLIGMSRSGMVKRLAKRRQTQHHLVVSSRRP